MRQNNNFDLDLDMSTEEYDKIEEEYKDFYKNKLLKVSNEYVANYEEDFNSEKLSEEEKEEIALKEKSAINLYLDDLQQYPLISKEEEFELLRQVHLFKSESAKQKILVSNLRLVISVAKKLMGQGLPLIDMISEGNIGLIRAIDKFDINQGFRFSTYAVWWIRQAIKKAIINKSRDIRIPTYQYEKYAKVVRYVNEYKMQYGKNPDNKLISQNFNISENKIEEMLSDFKEVVSFSEPIGDNLRIEDIIGTEVDYDEYIYKDIQTKRIHEVVNKILTDREYEVLKYRYGLQNTEVQTLKQIGDLLDITRERVRQIEKKALKKLEDHLKK